MRRIIGKRVIAFWPPNEKLSRFCYSIRLSSCSHPLGLCSFSLTGIIKSSSWIDEANIWLHILPPRWNKRTAAEINWLGFSRSAMPHCRGGMLMSFFLLISAPQTRRVGLLPFHCFIPKISSLSCRFSDLKGDLLYFTPFAFNTMWHKKLYRSHFSRWQLKKSDLAKHLFFKFNYLTFKLKALSSYSWLHWQTHSFLW